MATTQTAPKLSRYVLSAVANEVSPTGFGKGDAPTLLRKISGLFAACAQGAFASNLKMAYNAIAATGTITVTGTGTNGDTLTLLGTVITMKTSGALPANNEINIGGSVTAVANQIVGLINGTTALSPNSWAGLVYASNVAGVITVTCLIPGVIGNKLVATTKSSTALTITADIGVAIAGSEGTAATFKSGIA